jgi:iron complex outermembrane receptor protein
MNGVRPLVRSLALAFGSFAGLSIVAVAHAQTKQLDRVEITGSIIKRVDAETALPVTVIRAEELRRTGITTAEEAMKSIAVVQQLQGSSQAIGQSSGGRSSASLRGVGANRTLVLLNGRRVVNHAFDSGAVDLNAIPLAAIDRIEVLRDGASAIYGTDAIGGVINFILRSDYTGAGITAELQDPQAGGAEKKRYSLSGGFGDLNKQGFNVMAFLDYQEVGGLTSQDRSFAATGIIRDKGVVRTSPTTFPGNVSQNQGGTPPVIFTGNPGFAAGCLPPTSLPIGAGNTCLEDFVRNIDILPEQELTSLLLRGSLKLGNVGVASLEYMRAENKQINRVAPTPLGSVTMQPTNPFFPGAGITPAIPGLNPALPISVSWRTNLAGKRETDVTSLNERLVADLAGTLAGWDYKAGVTTGKNTVEQDFTDGYVRGSVVNAGVTSGVINPFGPQTPAGAQALNAAKVIGRVLDGKGEVTSYDARASRELFQLKAGPVAGAFGVEYRDEKFDYIVKPLARDAVGSGLELASTIGGKRDVTALFTEFNVPVVKDLEAQLAVRYDSYSDFGSTINPKIALRYQPTRALLLRSSFNTGFRAPTLYDLYQPPSITNTAIAYNDPLLCPGGVANTAIGGDPTRDCNIQFLRQLGGPAGLGRPVTDLDPETSRTFTFGIALEPTQRSSVSLDFWFINLKDSITQLGESAIFADPAKYASRFVRCNQVDPTVAATLRGCTTRVASQALAYITQPNENLGEIRTRGIDVSFAHRFGATPYGNISLGLDGSYVDQYRYQREKGGAFVSAAGTYADLSRDGQAASPVFRWQHVTTIDWSAGDWAVKLLQRYKAGYRDQNAVAAQFQGNVRSYQTWDAVSTYRGIKNVTLTAGVLNLLDEDPPFTNQGTTFQVGYDPRFTDPRGRTYLIRAGYQF